MPLMSNVPRTVMMVETTVIEALGATATVPVTSGVPEMETVPLTGTDPDTLTVPLTAGIEETLIVPLTWTGPLTCTVPLIAGIRDTSTTRPY